MSSGVFQSRASTVVECDPVWGGCGWVGWTDVTEDRERWSLTWVCPGCGHEEEENYR